jgi:hypothetical protein
MRKLVAGINTMPAAAIELSGHKSAQARAIVSNWVALLRGNDSTADPGIWYNKRSGG